MTWSAPALGCMGYSVELRHRDQRLTNDAHVMPRGSAPTPTSTRGSRARLASTSAMPML